MRRILKRARVYSVLMSPFVILYFFWGRGLRVSTIVLAFGAMWSLWEARKQRKHLWTTKLHDIWLVQILWTFASVEANLELFYRHAQPTVALLLVDFILILTIKGVFNGDRYTVDQP